MLAHRSRQLVLSALNQSKSAYASFTFDGPRFFARYQYSSSQASSSQARNGGTSQFSCQLYNKVFGSYYSRYECVLIHLIGPCIGVPRPLARCKRP